jgi:uncharacterized NAD(P)/FAD-binding protein YdhS
MSRHVHFRVCLIGAGPSAIAVIAALAQRRVRNLDICVLDSVGAPSASFAFHRARPEHLLNSRACAMSLDLQDRLAFARYAQAPADAFATRNQFARYLESVWQESLALLRQGGCRVTFRGASATEIAPAKFNQFSIRTSRGALHADKLILATGPRAPNPLAKPSPRWDSVWRFNYERLARWRHDGAALIVGSGLSAVDAATSLHNANWRGPIVIVSPAARLPHAHPETLSPACAPFAIETWANLSASALVRTLRREMTHAGDWRSVMDALRSQTNAIWCSLSTSVQARLLRHALPVWNRTRHRIAPEAEAIVQDLRQAGRLHFVRSRVTHITPLRHGVRAMLGCGAALEGAFGIDARTMALRSDLSQLEASLLRNGLAQPHPCGVGILPPDSSSGIFLIGAVLFGALLETTAIPEIVSQAGAIADELCGV